LTKEMQVKEGIVYTIGEFECPVCHTHHLLKCNPKGSMRVCPKCEYVDPPEWRHSKFSYWIDFCLFSDFERLEPELAKQLKDGKKVVQDKLYLYRATRSLTKVHRKAKADYGPQWQIPMEHHTMHPINNIQDYRKYWRLADPKQKKLLDDVFPEHGSDKK